MYLQSNNLDWFNFNLMVPDYDPDDEGDNMETKAQTFNRTRIECKS